MTDLGRFMEYLFTEKTLAVPTIISYKNAISSTIYMVTGVSLSGEPDIKRLIEAFYIERPSASREVPSWNLALALESLLKPPYEPMGTTDMGHVARKTLFLLAFASGNRRAELHALRGDDIWWSKDGSTVTLRAIPGFLSKTERANHPERAFKELTVPALIPFVGENEPERKLCPLRALKYYMHRTKAQRVGLKKPTPLFLPINKGHRRFIAKPTLTRWVRDVVTYAHANVDEEGARRLGRPLHELRAVSTSWAFQRTQSLDTVKKAALWAGHASSFTSYYMRDMTQLEEPLLKLGPLVAAQRVVPGAVPSTSSSR